jgi:hypothetical protein
MASLAQPGYAAGLVCHEGPRHRVPAVSPIPVMRAVPGLGTRLLVRGKLRVQAGAMLGGSRPRQRGNNLPGEV